MQTIILHLNRIVGDEPGCYKLTNHHNMLQKHKQHNYLNSLINSNEQQCLAHIWCTNLKKDDEGKTHRQDQPELRSKSVVLITPVVSIAAHMRQFVLFITSVIDYSV